MRRRRDGSATTPGSGRLLTPAVPDVPSSSGPVRVGLVVASPERGGFSAVVQEAHDLAARGCELSVLCPPGARLAELPQGTRHRALRAGSRDVHRAVRQIRRWARAEQPDVVHLHGRSAGVTGRIALAGTSVPVAYTAHGVNPRQALITRALDRTTQRALRRGTSLYLMVGESEREEWAAEHGFGGTRVALIPNVLDVDGIRALACEPAGEPPPEVLVPGAYHDRKRFEDVVRAAARARNRDVHIRFVGSEVGAPKRRQQLHRLAAELGVADRLHFDTETRNLPRAMATSRLVIFTSETEGLPIAALEAVAVGAATAWSDIPPHREVFGSTGTSFAVGDVDAIAEVLDAEATWEDLRPDDAHRKALFGGLAAAREQGLDALVGLAREAAGA